jgi:hypothetical protein
MAFADLNLKRNYLAHRLYDLFSGTIEETILPRTGLIEGDVALFSEKAEGLAEELSDFAGIVWREIGKHSNLSKVAQQREELL